MTYIALNPLLNHLKQIRRHLDDDIHIASVRGLVEGDGTKDAQAGDAVSAGHFLFVVAEGLKDCISLHGLFSPAQPALSTRSVGHRMP